MVITSTIRQLLSLAVFVGCTVQPWQNFFEDLICPHDFMIFSNINSCNILTAFCSTKLVYCFQYVVFSQCQLSHLNTIQIPNSCDAVWNKEKQNPIICKQTVHGQQFFDHLLESPVSNAAVCRAIKTSYSYVLHLLQRYVLKPLCHFCSCCHWSCNWKSLQVKHYKNSSVWERQ